MKLRNPVITEQLRVFYFKNGWTHEEVLQYLANHLSIFVSRRTLIRWKKKLRDPCWKHPAIPLPPVPNQTLCKKQIMRIVDLRIKTGWDSFAIKNTYKLKCSESTIKRLIKSKNLSRGSKIENMRINWVKWQRDHPDSLWQMDGTKLGDDWILSIIDDCSRFNPGIRKFSSLTTKRVTDSLEEIGAIHGFPREILTDNGTEFGGTFKNNCQFDKWCESHGIVHIRSRIHKPTTAGKVERFNGTLKKELPFCDGDIELFRYRYNHIRPHRSLRGKTPAEVYFSSEIRIKGVGFNQSKW